MTISADRINIINKFPKDPKKDIVYYVYDSNTIGEIIDLIASIHGDTYYDTYVSVRPISENTGNRNNNANNVLSYFDPNVFLYRNNGYN